MGACSARHSGGMLNHWKMRMAQVRSWLGSCAAVARLVRPDGGADANQMDPVYTPARKIHLYHCDHRGLPLAPISTEGATE